MDHGDDHVAAPLGQADADAPRVVPVRLPADETGGLETLDPAQGAGGGDAGLRQHLLHVEFLTQLAVDEEPEDDDDVLEGPGHAAAIDGAGTDQPADSFDHAVLRPAYSEAQFS